MTASVDTKNYLWYFPGVILNVSPPKICTVQMGGEIAYFYETQAVDRTNLVVTKPDI